jgi:purine nucleosidase
LGESPESERELAGPAAIVAAGRDHAGALDILTLGPLTNLAIALNVRPELVDQVRRLIVMGGAYHAGGNVTPHAEFNSFADPDAADQVFNASFRDVTLIGLDVTHRTLISRELWSRIPADARSGAALVRRVLGRTFLERDRTGHFMHDPLAAAVALDPTLVSGERTKVSVTRDGERRGQTRVAPADGGCMVARTVDAERFQRALAETLDLPEVAADVGFERAE